MRLRFTDDVVHGVQAIVSIKTLHPVSPPQKGSFSAPRRRRRRRRAGRRLRLRLKRRLNFRHIFMDSLHGHASIGHEKPHLESGANQDNNNEDKLENGPKFGKEPSWSSSSSSDSSIDEDFFQIDAVDSSKLITAKDEKPLQSGENSQLREPAVESTTKLNPESDKFVKFETNQFPSGQSTGKCNVPDPNRIPASIFTSSKGGTPMEWSVTSNESLFSIHIGKSGDLTSFCNSNLDNFSSVAALASPSPVKDVNSGSVLKKPGAAEEVKGDAMKDVLKATADGSAATGEETDAREKPSISGAPHSDSTSRISEGSVTSYRSFAFPILTMEGRSGSQKNESSVHQQAQAEQPQQSPPPTEPPISGLGSGFLASPVALSAAECEMLATSLLLPVL
uniref:Uncharacterized protein n=1 Tax=Ananas comosus var. bracteatus TaxID=296719 RepID=A0A6V7QJT6_ANACO|nr:unnamed protein product [Ananas comosus var. bracteatus]